MVALVVKNPCANARDTGEEMATHASILAWRIHGQRSLVGYNPQGLSRRHMRSGPRKSLGKAFLPALVQSFFA